MKGNPYLGYQKNRSVTSSLWERFNTGDLPSAEVLDPKYRLLLEEWRRCVGLGVSPLVRSGASVEKEAFARALDEQADLLDVVRPILDRAGELLGLVPGVLVFADPSGVLLHTAGDPITRVRIADAVNFTEGTLWSEGVAGNNGLGTAIAFKMPVHVYASEHYCEGWQEWTCAASPVAAPFSEDLLGVVDFSTLEKDYREEAVALANSLAGQIRAEMRVKLGFERVQLIHQFADSCLRYPSDRLAVVDRRGEVVRTSPGIPQRVIEAISGQGSSHDLPLDQRPLLQAGTHKQIGTLFIVPSERPPNRPALVPHDEPRRFGGFVAVSDAAIRVMEQIERVIPSGLNVLLIGETGTGKELIADFIHSASSRREGPFVAVNCGALSRELFESKFFGYERGAFTGADPKGRRGFFEAADGGTLFLDEIAELPMDIQAALLRVLETGRVRRIGAEQEVATNCRIVAATNRELLGAAEQGAFRKDLYYRLGTAKFVIPPLRDRPEDVPVLLHDTMEVFCRKHGFAPKTWSAEAKEILTSYRWPGNGRELRNVVETAYVCAGETITVDDLPNDVRKGQVGGGVVVAAAAADEERGIRDQVRRSEREAILSALQATANVSLAAKRLGISRSTFYRKCEAAGIVPAQVLAADLRARSS